MGVTIKYYGMLADHTGCAAECIEDYSGTAGALLNQLEHKYPGLKAMSFQMAHGSSVITELESLQGNEELALLPPFAGG